jgi:CspA family cold shock protein
MGLAMEMSKSTMAEANFQQGTVVRLNLSAGFGYVQDEMGENTYIFLVGKALNHAQARGLSLGKAVKFRVSGQGRVDELIVAEA